MGRFVTLRSLPDALPAVMKPTSTESFPGDATVKSDTSKRARRIGGMPQEHRAATAAGKDRSRFNAVKHGLSAKLEVLPGEDGDAFRARLEAWTATLHPRNEIERYLVERRGAVSWQLDRADRALDQRVADAPIRRRPKAARPCRRGRGAWTPPVLGSRGPGGLYARARVDLR